MSFYPEPHVSFGRSHKLDHGICYFLTIHFLSWKKSGVGLLCHWFGTNCEERRSMLEEIFGKLDLAEANMYGRYPF